MVEVLGRVIRVSLVDNVRFKEKVEENEDLSQMAIWMKSIPGRRESWNHVLKAGTVETGVASGVSNAEGIGGEGGMPRACTGPCQAIVGTVALNSE